MKLRDLYEAFMAGPSDNGGGRAVTLPSENGDAVASRPESVSDDEILNLCAAARNSDKFRRLFEDGDTSGHSSASEADLALCSILVFWTGPDADRIDRLFRRSKLMRDKWAERHSADGQTYGTMTVAKALSLCSEFYDWTQYRKPTSEEAIAEQVSDAEEKLQCLDDGEVDAERIFSQEVIEPLATLKVLNPSAFARRKAALKGKVNLNDLQLALKPVVERLKREHRNRSGDQGPDCVPYRAAAYGLVYDKYVADGTVPIQLTNFTATITGEVTEDDGSERRSHFEIEASLRGKEFSITVPAIEFAGMAWVNGQLGAEAILFAVPIVKDHVRVAIQLLSGNIPRRVVYTHTGWRKVGDHYVFLHAGGAIGPNGPASDTDVRLVGEHSLYDLSVPEGGPDLHECIRSVLELRRLTAMFVTCCLEGAAFRAPLGDCDSTLWVSGRSSAGKTELVARYQQLFGQRFRAKALPGSWFSTGNALEVAAHAAKDVVFVIDDFCPRGTTVDLQRYHQLAERVIRPQRNKSGRQRLWADGRMRTTKHPRGILVATGEDIPNGHSLRASMLILEMPEIDWDLLTKCQRLGTEGVYTWVMAAYIEWLAKRYDQVQKELGRELAELRERATGSAIHRRTPELVANIALGVRYFLNFAQDVGALSDEEANLLWEEAWNAIGDAAAAQREFLAAAEPERRFFELLYSALASGEAHVANGNGYQPQDAEGWGWREEGTKEPVYRPQGKRVGWLDRGELYLDPDASFKAVQEMARYSEGIAVGPVTLQKRLKEKKYLASSDPGRTTARPTLEGQRRRVLHIAKRIWAGRAGHAVQPVH